MIIPVIVATTLHILPVTDTVWWSTVGARVTEHRDGHGASCSLAFFNDNGSIAFHWDRSGRMVLTATDHAWNFPDNPHIPVAVQLGGTWLSNGGNSAVLDASSDGDSVTAPVAQPINALLPTADRVEVKTAAETLSISIAPFRLANIVDRVRQCQAVVVR